MILVFDCETTGLPKSYQAPLDDFGGWPRVVQLAWATYSNCGKLLNSHNFVIKPDGWIIPAEATALHGITQEMAQEQGVPIADALHWLMVDLPYDQDDFIVAHNVDFDMSVIGSEFLRNEFSNPLYGKQTICTMKESTEYCGLGEGKNGHHKYPKLSELYGILFPGEVIEREHDALQDALACARCFFELCSRGVISVENKPMFTIPDGPAITKLAHARRALEGLKQTRQDMLNVVLRDVLYLACDKQVREMQTLVDTLESNVREEGLKQYELDKNKKPGNGREIKLFEVVTVPDEAKARDWCLRNFTPALKMDYKLFDKAAISGSIPPEIATVEEQPRVQIAQDLTEFLPVPFEAGPEEEIPF